MLLFLPEPILGEGLRDIIALASLLLTVLGLWYAILQIRKTKNAANAAREAAERALQESQRSFHRYTAANARRFMNEAKIHIASQVWHSAVMRLNDLADQVALLGTDDPEWKEFATRLRQWESTCTKHARGSKRAFAVDKWTEFSIQLQAKIDGYYGPFAAAEGEEQ